ncbi:MAG TPA: hypothetical protein VN838_18405 [Bradyrhizobium sp.]|nr:hypothetical protein [Bradyrhizobium sp.]
MPVDGISGADFFTPSYFIRAEPSAEGVIRKGIRPQQNQSKLCPHLLQQEVALGN